MFTLPELPFTLPTLHIPNIRDIDLPTIPFPAIDFSKLDVNALRSITLPNVRDAAYMTVGLGVVAAERIQARREQLTAVINERVAQVREMVRAAV